MPVRKIPIGTRAVTGLHARSGARYESSLERDFFELMSLDPLVHIIEEQPVRIDYLDAAGKKRHYTPDVLVTFHSDPRTNRTRPPLLCEIKYRDEYRKKFAELRPKLRAAYKFARRSDWQFKVVTEREIRTIRFSNMRFLGGFRDRAVSGVDVDLLITRIEQHGPCSVDLLLSTITNDSWRRAELIPTLWHLVANNRAEVDLASPITMHSTISIS